MRDPVDKSSFWASRYSLISKIEKTEPTIVEKRLKERLFSCFKCDLSQNDILSIPYLKKGRCDHKFTCYRMRNKRLPRL